jgi:hypothetical protein
MKSKHLILAKVTALGFATATAIAAANSGKLYEQTIQKEYKTQARVEVELFQSLESKLHNRDRTYAPPIFHRATEQKRALEQQSAFIILGAEGCRSCKRLWIDIKGILSSHPKIHFEYVDRYTIPGIGFETALREDGIIPDNTGLPTVIISKKGTLSSEYMGYHSKTNRLFLRTLAEAGSDETVAKAVPLNIILKELENR